MKNALFIIKINSKTLKKMEKTKFVKSVKKYLNKKYGSIQKEWELSLKMLEDYVLIYSQCVEDLKNNGMKTQSGRINPCFKAANDAADKINKIINNFGLCPMSDGKIKAVETDNEKDIIKTLFD